MKEIFINVLLFVLALIMATCGALVSIAEWDKGHWEVMSDQWHIMLVGGVASLAFFGMVKVKFK